MDILAEAFRHLQWDYPEFTVPSGSEKILYWPGDPEEDIMICVLKDQDFMEDLHRHDFFFFNYAYKNDYEAKTEQTDNIITIREGECYIGQPFTGYGLRLNVRAGAGLPVFFRPGSGLYLQQTPLFSGVVRGAAEYFFTRSSLITPL